MKSNLRGQSVYIGWRETGRIRKLHSVMFFISGEVSEMDEIKSSSMEEVLPFHCALALTTVSSLNPNFYVARVT